MPPFRKETGHPGIFEEQILKDIASSKGKSIAQVFKYFLLRFSMVTHGNLVRLTFFKLNCANK